MRSMVEGALAAKQINSSPIVLRLLAFHAGRFRTTDAPSTALRAVPLPRFRGGG
jgi:hypothetical protein